MAIRVMCGGITVMSMVSVVDSNGSTVRTYGDDGMSLVQKTVHLTAQFGEGLFSKIFMIDKRSNAHLH